jgi:hypothetical protein
MKKGVSPVLATGLILLLVVVVAVSFEFWYGGFQTSLMTDVESDKNSLEDEISIEGISGGILYIRNPSENTRSIQSIKVNDVECSVSGNISDEIEQIDIYECIGEVTSPRAQIKILTDKEVITKNIFLNVEEYAFVCLTNGTNGFAGGDGSFSDPYQICNCEQLQNMNDVADYNYFVLINDIDCTISSTWDGGAGFDPITSIISGFDGGGYLITDLYINRPGENKVGLFKYISSGEINRVGIVDAVVTGNNEVGILAGEIGEQSISNVYTRGSVSGGNYVGGIIGHHTGSGIGYYVSNTYFVGTVTYSTYGGGIAGYCDYCSGAMNVYGFYDSDVAGVLTGKGTPQTTAQMQTAQTFRDAFWDENIWILQDGQYPKLAWEND